MSIEQSVEVIGLDALRKRIPDKAKADRVTAQIIERVALAIRAEWIKGMPSRSGATRRTIQHTVDRTALTGAVFSLSPVAKYLETGTGLYGLKHQRIYPKNAQALRWPVGGPTAQRLTGTHRSGVSGPWAFARSIRGMRAQPSLTPAIQASRPYQITAVQEAARELLGGALGAVA